MKGHALRCALLVVLVVLSYGPSLRLPFFMDDYMHLTLIRDPALGFGKTQLNAFSTDPVPSAWIREALPWWANPDFRFHYFRPVPTLVMALNLYLWDIDPWGFHLASLILHATCVLLLYGLALSLGLRPGIALLGALAAGLHFNHVFAVSWMPNQDITLAGIALVGMLWVYDTHLKRAARDHPGRGRPAIAFLLLVLGVLSKENLVLAPALLVILTWVRTGAGFRPGSGGLRLRPYLTLAPFFAFSFAYVIWYGATGHGVSTGYLLLSAENGVAGNLAIMVRNLYLYLLSLVGFVPPDFADIQALLTRPPNLYYGLGFIGLWVALAIWKRSLFRERPVLWLFLAWTGLYLFTPLWFIPLGRLLFIATLGFGLFVAAFLQGLLDRIRRRLWRLCLTAAFVLYFVLLPFGLDSATTSFLTGQGDAIHLDLERVIAEQEKDLPDGGSLFLLNVPNPASVYLAGLVHRFYHPATRTRIYGLGNVADVPDIFEIRKHSFCMRNPDGLVEMDVPFPTIEVTEGLEVRMPAYRATVREVKEGTPVEVCFSFAEDLDTPSYRFLRFRDGKPERVRFGEAGVPGGP